MVTGLYPRRNWGLFSGPWGKIPPPRNSMTSWKQLMLMVIRLKYRHQETASRYLELFPHLQNLNSCLVFFFNIISSHISRSITDQYLSVTPLSDTCLIFYLLRSEAKLHLCYMSTPLTYKIYKLPINLKIYIYSPKC